MMNSTVTGNQQAGGRATAETAVSPAFRRCTWRDVFVGFLLALCCFVVYNANGRAISAGDAVPARYLPFAIIKHGTLRLDPILPVAAQGRKLPASALHLEGAFWMVPTDDGHRVSLYSIALPVVIAPLYVPAVLYLDATGWSDDRLDYVGRLMEKLVASGITALSAMLLFLAVRRRVDTGVSVLLTVAYAFGTSAWVLSSQALWQHGFAQLLAAAALLCVTGPATRGRVILAGLCCGLLAANRPPDAVIGGALGLYGLYWAGRHVAWIVAAAALPMVLIVIYNVTLVGSLIGGYGLLGKMSFLRSDMWWVSWGLSGLLISPARGLLVFSPFLLFLVLAWRHRPATRQEVFLSVAIAAAALAQLVGYARSDWRAGYSWGPRFLTDIVPLLVWLLAPIVAALGRVGRAGFVATMVVAIAIEAIGAFYYTGATDAVLYSIPAGPTKLRPAFEWRNAPYVASLAGGRVPADLWRPMRGSLDRFEVDGVPVDTIAIGQSVDAVGWTLHGRDAPMQVAVTINGEFTPFAARTFFERPDLRDVVPGAGPAGWRIPIDTTNLPPGRHTVSVLAWTSEKSGEQFIGSWPITVRAPHIELDAAFQLAATRVLEHQDASGYWLTSFTTATRFEQPGYEMNTYLTSVMVDLLEPLVGAGTGFAVDRARRHLTEQIEPGGLVRYHGLPTGPGIGTLGCRITPDTDDTALVWRLAPPPDRAPLASALDVIDTFRRPDGLYRTWLAPLDGYECLDPGRDPNPADITIQMHLLQLLLTERPAAAADLCAALQREVSGTSGWVYYQVAPLVPMLRVPDLARAGCALELPESRRRTTVEGQEIWLTVARLLTQLSGDGPRPRRGDVIDVLERLAADEFALIRTNPPLLYHNDLTATVPRYYWSEDVGYALWLRLAAASTAAPR
jgi:hypothetical protein